MKNTVKDTIVTLCGAVTSVLVAFIVYGIEVYFGTSVYTWTIWLVVPVGAMIAGFGAATGYWGGARLINHKPSGRIVINIALVSASTFFLIHYLSYYNFKVDGVPVRNLVPFTAYLKLVLTHTSVRLGHSSNSLATGELGAWGYSYAFLQIFGFALGGMAAFAVLDGLPYCQACGKYLKRKSSARRHTPEAAKLDEFMKMASEQFKAGELAKAVEAHKNFGDATATAEAALRVDLAAYQCPACPQHFLRLTVDKRVNKEWSSMNELKREAYTQQPLVL